MVEGDRGPRSTTSRSTGTDPRNNAREVLTGHRRQHPGASVTTVDATAPPLSTVIDRRRERHLVGSIHNSLRPPKTIPKTKFRASISYPSKPVPEPLVRLPANEVPRHRKRLGLDAQAKLQSFGGNIASPSLANGIVYRTGCRLRPSVVRGGRFPPQSPQPSPFETLSSALLLLDRFERERVRRLVMERLSALHGLGAIGHGVHELRYLLVLLGELVD